MFLATTAFCTNYSIKTVVWVSSVFNNSSETISIVKRVTSLDNITISNLFEINVNFRNYILRWKGKKFRNRPAVVTFVKEICQKTLQKLKTIIYFFHLFICVQLFKFFMKTFMVKNVWSLRMTGKEIIRSQVFLCDFLQPESLRLLLINVLIFLKISSVLK